MWSQYTQCNGQTLTLSKIPLVKTIKDLKKVIITPLNVLMAFLPMVWWALEVLGQWFSKWGSQPFKGLQILFQSQQSIPALANYHRFIVACSNLGLQKIQNILKGWQCKKV
jgi:hypothetical protein